MDTLDVRPRPGVVLKHFTARDMVSRWYVVEVHTRATARGRTERRMDVSAAKRPSMGPA